MRSSGILTSMPDDLRVTPNVVVPSAELTERFSRSGGPGGQSVNTADTRVELSFDVRRSPALPPHLRTRALARLRNRLVDGVLTVTASEHRSQLRNRAAARDRMLDLLRDAVAPPLPPRRATRPSRGARERRLTEKHQRGQLKRGRQTRDDG